MKILLTGATGYIGRRLLPSLVQNGHHVICCVRDPKRFNPPKSVLPNIEVVKVDLLDVNSLGNIPEEIDAAYYLVHSMSGNSDFENLELQCALNFKERLNQTQVGQVIYLSGITNEDKLSKHLDSRKQVEEALKSPNYNSTTLRAGIIIGSGSASFEIIRDLVEKLPIMITPKWLNTKCQPIGISDVLQMLQKTLFCEATYNQAFDIGGADVLTYKEMLLIYADSRNLKRRIYTLPIMTPRLSSYWLYFVTSTSYKLAIALVDSMKVEVVCRDSRITEILEIEPISYKQALKKAFEKIDSNQIVSSWKDALISGGQNFNISEFIDVPTFGCFKDVRKRKIANRETTIDRIWGIGGKNGWYHANFLWRIRGYLDKLVGGVGLRRGRTNENTLNAGDALDFWRVLYADREEGRLLLFAEMKLPGEAWLEFRIEGDEVIQTATFRPRGVLGRLYWYSVVPLHGIVFNGMIRHIAEL